MATTFETVWRSVRLSVPNAPPLLVQQWVLDAYRTLRDRRGWSWAIIQNQLIWADARSLAVATTAGSPTVTSGGLFVAADVGRQFRVGTYPIYTIIARPDANTLTLDLPYEGSGVGAVTAQILDAYATLPEGFSRFVAIVDPNNQRLVPWWATWEEMDLLDPIRASTASVPRLLAARKTSSLSSTAGRTQYEYYPKPTVAGALQYYAIGAPTALAQDYVFPGLLGDRPDILRTGALAQAAQWPGTTDLKNPYFNLALSIQLGRQFDALSNQLDLRDDDVYQQSIDNLPWQKWRTWVWAYDTALLRMTDATLGSYAGFGGFAPY